MTQKIGVLGSGIVGKTLAKGFAQQGYTVQIGSRDPQKLAEWKETEAPEVHLGDFNETAAFGDLVVLAVKGNVALQALEYIDAAQVQGKTVIDTTNPISDTAPENGVLNFFTDQNSSLMEKLQQAYPEVNFVKAFSCVGSPHMIKPDFGDQQPSMFICGNETSAKAQVSELLNKLGWEVEDMGKVESARAIEPLCMLWCIPGLNNNQWNHAFKLLKK